MEERFGPAAMAILAGNLAELADLVTADAELITRPSAVSHPSLLQFVACEAAQLPDPAGAARVLVAAGAELQGPLVAAAGCGSFAVVDVLLDAGADIDGGDLAATTSWTPLDEALYWSNADMAQVLLDRGAGIRALSTAAGLGDLGAIAACFDATGNLTAAAGRIGSPFAETVPLDRADERQSVLDHAFVMAADCGRRAAAADLLERGANIDAVPPGFHWRGTASTLPPPRVMPTSFAGCSSTVPTPRSPTAWSAPTPPGGLVTTATTIWSTFSLPDAGGGARDIPRSVRQSHRHSRSVRQSSCSRRV
ncbi:MAG: hypothetical protein R2710_18785 [Acidimicrobiales bacterium]